MTETLFRHRFLYTESYPYDEGALGGYHSYTHMSVNDPTVGYGILIENMLDAAA